MLLSRPIKSKSIIAKKTLAQKPPPAKRCLFLKIGYDLRLDRIDVAADHDLFIRGHRPKSKIPALILSLFQQHPFIQGYHTNSFPFQNYLTFFIFCDQVSSIANVWILVSSTRMTKPTVIPDSDRESISPIHRSPGQKELGVRSGPSFRT